MTETIQRHEAAADADRPRNRFAFFGQLVDVKGLLVVFEALKLYAETHSEPIVFEINGANLNFASDAFRTKFDAFLEAAEGMKPVVEVRFNGGYAMEDLSVRMARVDWTIVPSIWWEIFGLVVSEAFMFRKPPIVSNLGGIGERVTHDANGLHFNVGDARSLMETMHRAVTEQGLHERLSGNSPGVPPWGISFRRIWRFTGWRRLRFDRLSWKINSQYYTSAIVNGGRCELVVVPMETPGPLLRRKEQDV